jgi:hypothetical protein
LPPRRKLKFDPVGTPCHSRPVGSVQVEPREAAGAVFVLLTLLQTVKIELRVRRTILPAKIFAVLNKHRIKENNLLEDRCISGALIRLSLLNAAFIEES